MTLKELDEMAAQLDSTVPYYLPRLIEDYRADLSELAALEAERQALTAKLLAQAESVAVQLAVHAFPESPERTARAVALAQKVAKAVLEAALSASPRAEPAPTKE